MVVNLNEGVDPDELDRWIAEYERARPGVEVVRDGSPLRLLIYHPAVAARPGWRQRMGRLQL